MGTLMGGARPGLFALVLVLTAGVCGPSTPVGAASPEVHPDWIHLSSAFGDLPVPSASHQQTASLVLDVNRDGMQDFVIAARRKAPALVWYRRGAAGWERLVIEPDVLPIEAGGAFFDIDRDGDLDIVMGEDARGNRVHWWENPHPEHPPDRRWKRHTIKDGGASKHHDQIFGDFDGDGEAELVFWNQNARKLFLARIPDDPTAGPWPYVSIFEHEEAAEGLAKADVDGDGRIDLIGGGRWFEHAGGTRFIPHLIDAKMQFARAAAGQLEEGGPVEVVFVVGDGSSRLKWYERTGDAWQGHDLSGFDVNHGHTLDVVDLDGDGHLDIVCAEMHSPGAGDDARLWVFHGDGRGNFEKQVISTGIGNHESKVADLDGDGDLDILVKPYKWQAPRVDVLLNRRSRLDRWTRHVIDAAKPWRSVFVVPGDLDGDGDLDVATGGWWYENPGDLGAPWPRHPIGAPLYNVAAIHDLDGDGDLDILGTQGRGSNANATFAFARNDGTGGFRVFDEVARASGDFLQGVAIERFTGDALEVALSWHAAGHGVQMLTVPGDPAAGPWPLRTISEVAQDEALSAGDIDGDGRLDLLLGTKWLRNTGSGWKVHTLADAPVPDRNRLADLDGDGRLDAVVGAEAVSRPGALVWLEQPEVATETWRRHPIATITGPMSLDVADLDGDGDLDLAVGEHDLGDPERAKLYVLENADGAGGKWISHIVAIGDEHHDGAILADLDGDGDLDMVSIGWSHERVLVYENRAAP